jgi:hypothetical protein
VFSVASSKKQFAPVTMATSDSCYKSEPVSCDELNGRKHTVHSLNTRYSYVHAHREDIWRSESGEVMSEHFAGAVEPEDVAVFRRVVLH